MGDRCNNVLVLVSGGLDSASCIPFYLQRSFRVSCLFVDYGQKARSRERLAARTVARHFGLSLGILTTKGLTIGSGEIVGRNALLWVSGLMSIKQRCGLVSLGIHAGTDYPDCSPAFVRKIQLIFDLCAGGRIRAAAPFLEWRKDQVFKFALGAGVPIESTYSCEAGSKRPCGRCSSCLDRERLSAC